MRLFRQRVFKKVRPKKLNGNFINGDMLLELCYAYTKAFNSGGVPCIESAWNGMCKAQCTKVVEDVTADYSTELSKLAEEAGHDPQKIKLLHKEVRSKNPSMCVADGKGGQGLQATEHWRASA